MQIKRERPCDDFLNIINMKIRVEEAPEDLPEAFFLIQENVFQIFCTKFSLSFYVISLFLNISYCLSVNHHPESRCVICIGDTVFALMLHFLHGCYTSTAQLPANQNGVIF